MHLHKAWGSLIITRFLKEVVSAIYDVSVCTIDPEPANTVAIRAYEKAGFSHLKTVWNPIDSVLAYIMTKRLDVPANQHE